jgi:hypothetical protein
MLKYLTTAAVCSLLFGCAHLPKPGPEAPTAPAPQACIGSTALPPSLSAQFEPVADEALLAKAVGKEKQGALCQGRVYQAKAEASVVLFRAWNSTNPNSRLGSWWAMEKPEGRIVDYRKDYEICYQWTPLDMLVQCKVKPGAKVVIGPGQSMECSQYLTYPASARQQVFIDNAESALSDCTNAFGVFGWQ